MSNFADQLRLAAQGSAIRGGIDSVFSEEPVPLTVFVQDHGFLDNPPLSAVQYEALRHIERIYYPDTYPIIAAEFETGKAGSLTVGSYAVHRHEAYWSQPVRMINFATLQWSKGCCAPHTEVYNALTGQWVPISSLGTGAVVQGVEDPEHLSEVPALAGGSNRLTAPVEGTSFHRGHGRCVRVTTTTGAMVDVYVGHLFVTWQTNAVPTVDRYLLAKPVWRQAGELKKGDRLAILSKLDCLQPVSQEPREVELVGYWIGDGSMPVVGSRQWAFYIASDAAELRARYTELVESYMGITAKNEMMPSGAIRIRATQAGSGRKVSTPLLDIIRKWGLYGSRAWDKRVPIEFFSLPDDQLALFISALWDTDGSIYFSKSGTPGVEYDTTSEGLARDIQRLLFRFGVVSRLSSAVKTYTYRGEKREGRRSWRLVVNADKYVKRLLSVLKLHGEKELRRVRALEHVAVRRQQDLDGDVYWDTVVSVEDIGEMDYWDMRVPTLGTYVAGTIPVISGNSGKDHTCRVASMRIAYLLLCLKSPQDYYGMPAQDTIHLLNVARSAGQAQQAFFMPIGRAVRRGWFKDRCDPRQNVISYEKNVECISGHSDAETQEGLNLILGVADEIDAFKSRKEMVFRRGADSREPSKSAEGILNMMRSSGAPQPLDAMVLTPDRGFVPLGDLHVGDAVVDPIGGQASKVAAVYPQGVRNVYRLSFSDGSAAEATSEHLWAMVKLHGPQAAVELWTTEKMAEYSWAYQEPLALPTTALDTIDFDGPDSLIDPYLMGLLLGGGEQKGFNLTFVTVDAELRALCEKSLPPNMEMLPDGPRSPDCFSYQLVPSTGAQSLVSDEFRRLGLWGCNRSNRFVPDAYKLASARDRLAVLQGLLDSAGFAGRGINLVFVSVSRQLRDDVAWLARSLGLWACCGYKAMTRGGFRRLPRVLVRRELQSVRLSRRTRRLDGKPQAGERSRGRFLQSIDFVRTASCACISVTAESGLYVTDDFIPTHNTRFPKVFKQVRISYPRFLGSTIQQLTAEGRADIKENGEASRHFVSGPLATWEVNPRVKGKEDFADEYRDDPVMARAKYECKPSRAIDPYFHNTLAVDAAFVTTKKSPVEVFYQIEESPQHLVWVPSYQFSSDFFPVRGAQYSMHGDLAVSGDRAGIAMAHVVRYSEHEASAEDEDGAMHRLRELRPHVKVDFVISYTSNLSVTPPREIQIRWARQLCFELIRRGFSVRRFTFDAFQSTDSMQLLKARGIASERVSTDISEDPWRNLRDLMYEGRLTIPRLALPDGEMAPMLLREELLSLSRLPNGKIDHPTGGCFVGETHIPLIDGTVHRIQDLEGSSVWVYSARPDGRVVPGFARVRRTKNVSCVVEVGLSSGYSARCTPDHLWLLSDGSYKRAVDLELGVDRLKSMPSPWTDYDPNYPQILEESVVLSGVLRQQRVLSSGGTCFASDSVGVLTDLEVSYVVLVELNQPVAVYDLEVDYWHNFALAGGVFVHNSKDEADALACAVLGAVVLGGKEEAGGARTHYMPPDITVGRSFEMPFGVNPSTLWESDPPSFF